MKFIVNDKEVEAKKLEVLHLTTDISEHLKEKMMQDAVQMAGMLGGTDKSKFLADAYKALPGGLELLEKAQEYLQTPAGYEFIIEAATGVTDVDGADLEAYIPVIEYALGVESGAPEEVEAGGEPETDPLALDESPQD
jgi:hypothetical protein